MFRFSKVTRNIYYGATPNGKMYELGGYAHMSPHPPLLNDGSTSRRDPARASSCIDCVERLVVAEHIPPRGIL